MDKLSLEHHINHLQNLHEALDSKLDSIKETAPDEEVHQIKKQKLDIKDQITQTERELEAL